MACRIAGTLLIEALRKHGPQQTDRPCERRGSAPMHSDHENSGLLHCVAPIGGVAGLARSTNGKCCPVAHGPQPRCILAHSAAREHLLISALESKLPTDLPTGC